MTTTDQGPAVDTAGPAPQEGTDTVSTDQDPGVLRAQARARAKLADKLADQLRDLGELLPPASSSARSEDKADALDWAARLGSLVKMAEVAQRDAVDLARAHGATWQAIGDTLGMNRQNAQAKYGKRGTK